MLHHQPPGHEILALIFEPLLKWKQYSHASKDLLQHVEVHETRLALVYDLKQSPCCRTLSLWRGREVGTGSCEEEE